MTIPANQYNFLRLLAFSYVSYGKAPLAAIVLNFLCAFNPDDVWAHTMLAYTMMELKNPKLALESALKALESKQEDQDPQLRHMANLIRGQALHAQGSDAEGRLLALQTIRHLS